ncbi:MAG: DNA recombination protein RmuC [Porphyromonas sp.]|nr:DNA recombination protein RmuC [Porphyromonas sp.]
MQNQPFYSHNTVTSQIPIYILFFLIGAVIALLLYYIYYRRQFGAWQEALSDEQRARREESQELIRLQEQNRSIHERLESEKSLHEELQERQQENFDRQLEALQSKFTALSEEITKKRSEELTSTNEKHLHSILAPLKESISKMQTAFETNKSSSAEQSGKLEATIKLLMERTLEVGEKADTLSQALRHESKRQGNWGELILERLLEMEDLKRGISYDTQVTLHGPNGNLLRPDALLYYPDDKVLIIDAKVSLKAYVDYFESDDDQEKERLKRAHLESVKKHIDELADKKYNNYIEPPREALDYVIMFMPNQGALDLALQLDPDLWRYAIDRRVFLANDYNLLVLLRIIKVVWRQHTQERNIDEIIREAELIVDRVAKLGNDMEQVGKTFDTLRKRFDQVELRLRGTQGIYRAAERLMEHGVKNNSKFSIPATEELGIEEMIDSVE